MPKRNLDLNTWAMTMGADGPADACWPWKGCLDKNGYGRCSMRAHGLSRWAHRAVYQVLVGPIPEGQSLDHDCHTRDLACPGGDTCPHRRCVNPAHLRPMTIGKNVQLGRLAGWAGANAAKTHCPQGHAYSGDNLIVYTGKSGRPGRFCRACIRERSRRYRALKRAAQ